MSEESNFTIRLSKAAKEFNVGMGTILDFLAKKGFQVDSSPNTKLSSEMYELLVKEYQGEREVKKEAKKLGDLSYKGGSVSVDSAVQSLTNNNDDEDTDEVFIRTSTISPQKPVEKPAHKETEVKPAEAKKAEPETVTEKAERPAETVAEPKEEANDPDSPIKVLGKIDLESLNTKTRPDKKSKEEKQREAKEKAEREKALAEQRKAEKQAEAKRLEETKKAEAAKKALEAKKAAEVAKAEAAKKAEEENN